MRQEVVAGARGTAAQRRPDGPARASAATRNEAALAAAEHERAEVERMRREQLEWTAAQLAAMVAREHALVARERLARERAESEAEQLRDLLFSSERRLAHRRR
jgi:hypothetical protein